VGKSDCGGTVGDMSTGVPLPHTGLQNDGVPPIV